MHINIDSWQIAILVCAFIALILAVWTCRNKCGEHRTIIISVAAYLVHTITYYAFLVFDPFGNRMGWSVVLRFHGITTCIIILLSIIAARKFNGDRHE